MSEALPRPVPEVLLPGPNDPIFPPGEAPSPADPIPAYADEVWPVRFFSANPSMSNSRIRWETYPARYREHIRLATWTLFNLPLPDELITGPAMKATLSALRIYHTACDWRLFGVWAEGQGIASLSDVGTRTLEDYAEYLRSERRVSRNTAINHLTALTRLWGAGQQTPDLALAGPPPWLVSPVDDYLPVTTRVVGENVTEPLAPDTISALLKWSMTFIEDCAEPILAAHAYLDGVRAGSVNRQRERGLSDNDVLRAWFDTLRDAQESLPVRSDDGNLDNAYISAVTGVRLTACYRLSKWPAVREYKTHHGAPVMVPLEAAGEAAAMLPDRVALTEVPTLVDLLVTACFVVVSYLTGMRPGEVLALEVNSLQPSARSGGWMLLHSKTFKGVRDENGNHDSAGAKRAAPWVAVAPVSTAIRVLERLHPKGGLLFGSTRSRAGTNRSIAHSTSADRVQRLIEHINTRSPGAIPPDPLGRVTPLRFRRTLAWHIANQPGGLVALAVQYGHLRTAISEGYASRAREGIQQLIDFETARSVAIRLSDAHEAVSEGEGVSGPSALRFVTALRQQTEQFHGIVTTDRQARSLLGNPSLAVFQNEQAFVWCNFRSETALCMSDREADTATTPRLDNCNPNCTNVARTDAMAAGMRDRADHLERQADATPVPVGDRLRKSATKLRDLADRHDRDRRTLGEFDATH